MCSARNERTAGFCRRSFGGVGKVMSKNVNFNGTPKTSSTIVVTTTPQPTGIVTMITMTGMIPIMKTTGTVPRSRVKYSASNSMANEAAYTNTTNRTYGKLNKEAGG